MYQYKGIQLMVILNMFYIREPIGHKQNAIKKIIMIQMDEHDNNLIAYSPL